MSNDVTISIALDFSRYPAGRTREDGPLSGQIFREDKLQPLLKAGKTVIINLDNVLGYGSSFLEEAFGGLVRAGFSAEQLHQQLQFVSNDDPSLPTEIWFYIDHVGGDA